MDSQDVNNNQNEIEELLKRINDIELVKEEDLKDMDFYELAYYMQNLNIIDSLDQEDGE